MVPSFPVIFTTPYCAQARALFARFTTQPTAVRARLINDLIMALIAAGVWAKLDALYLMAAETSQAARQNWIANQYNLSAVNGPTFTADRGYAGDGSSSYLNTQFNPTTAAAPLFQQNSATMGLGDRTAVGTAGKSQMGSYSGGGFTIYTTISAGTFFERSNAVSGPSAVNVVNSGRYLVSRTGASAGAAYKNGALLVPDTQPTIPVLNLPQFMCALNQGGGATAFSADQLDYGVIGGAFTATDAANFDAAIATYLTAVGA